METVKKVFKWIDNYWYHYKWPTVIITFFAVVITVFAIQMADVEPYDVNVIYSGPCLMTANQRLDIESAFVAIMEKDYDGNGKKTALLYNVPSFTDEQAERAKKEAEARGETLVLNEHLIARAQQKIANEVMGGENYICLLDKYWYDIMMDNNALLELDSVLGYVPDESDDGYGVRLKDIDFGSYFTAFSVLPDDTVLCMRRISMANTVLGNNKKDLKFENSKMILCDIFAFEEPAE